jgi:hypothetical protein
MRLPSQRATTIKDVLVCILGNAVSRGPGAAVGDSGVEARGHPLWIRLS